MAGESFLQDNLGRRIRLVHDRGFFVTEAHQQIHLTQPHMDILRGFKSEYIESTTIKEIEIK